MKIISEISVSMLRKNICLVNIKVGLSLMLALIYRLLISNKVKISKSSFAVGSKDCKEKSQIICTLQSQDFLTLL